MDILTMLHSAYSDNDNRPKRKEKQIGGYAVGHIKDDTIVIWPYNPFKHFICLFKGHNMHGKYCLMCYRKTIE